MKLLILILLCTLTILVGCTTQTPIQNSSNKLIYVNSSHPNCAEKYTRLEAQNYNTPWCSATINNTNKLEDGDLLFISNGIYNGRIEFNNKPFTKGIKIIGQTRDLVILSNLDLRFNKINNNLWIETGSKLNSQLWKTNHLKISQFSSIYFQNGTSFFIYNNLTTFNSTNNNYDYSAYSDDKNDILYLKFKDNKLNPNNLALNIMAEDYSILSFNNNTGTFEVHNITFAFAKQAIFIRNTSILIDNISIKFASAGIKARDSANQKITVQNSLFNGYFDQDWQWYDLHKPIETYSETKALEFNSVYGTIKIFDNLFTNWSNGITFTHSQKQRYPSTNNEIRANKFINIYDDAIEVENIVSNWTISYNTGHDLFVSISLEPINCTGTCKVVNNDMISNKSVKYNLTNRMNAYSIKYKKFNEKSADWEFKDNFFRTK